MANATGKLCSVMLFVKQIELAGNCGSFIEITLDKGSEGSLEGVVHKSIQSLFNEQHTTKKFTHTASDIDELQFMSLLSNLSEEGWGMLGTNAYHIAESNAVVKTFYYEKKLDATRRSSVVRGALFGDRGAPSSSAAASVEAARRSFGTTVSSSGSGVRGSVSSSNGTVSTPPYGRQSSVSLLAKTFQTEGASEDQKGDGRRGGSVYGNGSGSGNSNISIGSDGGSNGMRKSIAPPAPPAPPLHQSQGQEDSKRSSLPSAPPPPPPIPPRGRAPPPPRPPPRPLLVLPSRTTTQP